MDKTFTNYFRVLQITASLGFLTMVGCASSVSPVKFSPMANPAAEIKNQKTLMGQAQEVQVDVLAETPYKKANEYLMDAQKLEAKGTSSEKIFESLGYSKAYLNKALENSAVVRPSVEDVALARIAAIKAGARLFPKQLNNIDDELSDMTSSPEQSSKIASQDKLDLQNQYQNLELMAIKQANLGEAKNIISVVQKKGAEKITPVAYKEAVENINAAEKIIETDRHSMAKIAPASEVARASALRVFNLLASEKNSRNQTPEQRAMTLEARDQAVVKANALTSEVVEESSMKDKELAKQDERIADQQESITSTEEANKLLLDKEYDEKVVNTAAAQFNKNEADVYRQDGNLVIRLKSMNFASNRSDLPAASFSVLNKVKNVMRNLAPDQVMIEGHTDAIGDASKNQKLSELRAQSVKKYFETESYLKGDVLEASGFGYSKPLATNKTKEGRAQNRRVDIVIKTTQPKNL